MYSEYSGHGGVHVLVSFFVRGCMHSAVVNSTEDGIGILSSNPTECFCIHIWTNNSGKVWNYPDLGINIRVGWGLLLLC